VNAKHTRERMKHNKKSITEFTREFDKIMNKSIRNEFGKTQSLRSWVNSQYWQIQYEKLKPTFTKIMDEYQIDPDFIKRFNYRIKLD